MSTEAPRLIVSDNLTSAWGEAFLSLYDKKGSPLWPITLSITGFNDGRPKENSALRQLLEKFLNESDLFSVKVSSSTIFPYNEWRRQDSPTCKEFSTWYLSEFLPRLKARDRRNGPGTYFERMISFRGLKRKGNKFEERICNQLAFIITEWEKSKRNGRRPRQSALQVGCFDPAKDHTGQPVRGFPCLQQVGFGYDDNNGLAVNAFYPTQFLFDRGYGNYLGLINLGTFMAEQLGLRMVRLNCFIARPELGSIPKRDLAPLAEAIRKHIQRQPTTPITLGAEI